MTTIARGVRGLRRLSKELKDTAQLQRAYAFAVKERAQRNAAGRPTPQASGVAASLRVSRKGGAVLGLPSAQIVLSGRLLRAKGVNYGAEYGSDTHRQFAPRREGGYWLNPAAEQVDDSPGEAWLKDKLESSLRGMLR